MKTNYREVETKWESLHEYYLSFRCPYCTSFLDDMQFDIGEEGNKVNRLLKCPNCERKFRLKVEGF